MSKNYTYRLVAVIFIIIQSVSAVFINQKDHQFENLLRSDAIGYYAWLPATIIYGDADFAFCDSVFTSSPAYQGGSFENILIDVSSNDKMNKYPLGSALCSATFFLVSHVYGRIVSESKGFEKHYQIAWFLSALFFSCIGIYLLFSIGARLEVPLIWSSLLIAGSLWGTNWFHYNSFDIGYSHAFTFGWMSIAAYSAFRFLSNQQQRFAWLSAGALGLIVLIRPFNVVLIPFLLLSVYSLTNKSLKLLELNHLIFPFIFFSLIIFLQFAGNYWQTGNAFVYSYGAERFDFSNQHFNQFLFGFEIGCFTYSPFFALLILCALVSLLGQKKYLTALVIVTVFILITWSLSCWSTWTFGCTLGNRPLVDLLPIFILPALRLNTWKSKLATTCFVLMAGVFIFYSQILHYQYRNWILDRCNMNEEKFKDVFLRTNPNYTFYTSEDWSFDHTIGDSILLSKELKQPVLFQKRQADAGFLEMDFVLDSLRKHRISISFDGRFIDTRGENRLLINGSKGNKRAYADYHQKFIKKHLKSANEWYPFVYEFFVPYSSDSLHYVFLIVDNEEASLEMKNIRANIIGYSEDR